MTEKPFIAEPPLRVLLATIILAGLAILTIVLTAPPNLLQNNEDRMAAYVRDVVENGHWLCQRDGLGRIASKPPFYAWISSLASLCVGEINRFTIYFPSILATLSLGGIIFAAGRARLGWLAGLCGALAYLLSHVAEKQMVMARYDGLLALTVTLAALAAFRAWTCGRGWTWFWLAAAAGTLTKGPLALVLPVGGLLAAWWEKRASGPAPIRGSHAAGLALFFLITGGWFALAWWQMGEELIHKMLFLELFSHAVVSDEGGAPGSGFIKPLLAFLTDFAPWSVFTGLGLWRIWKHPSNDPAQRRFERFLVCWFLTSLIIFSLSPHQRSRLILPLIPPAALLAGSELARLLARWKRTSLIRGMAVVIVVALGSVAAYEHGARRHRKAVQHTEGWKQLALQIREKVGSQFPLTYVNSPFVFQYYLGAQRDLVPASRAAKLLQGEAAVFLVLEDTAPVRKHLEPGTPGLHELARWPAAGEPVFRIVGNHPRLEWAHHLACGIGPVQIEMLGARMERVRGHEFWFSSYLPPATVNFTHDADRPLKLRVRAVETPFQFQERALMPGEVWRVELGRTASGPTSP